MMHSISHSLLFLLLSFILKSGLHILTTFAMEAKSTNLFKSTGQQYQFWAFTLHSQELTFCESA